MTTTSSDIRIVPGSTPQKATVDERVFAGFPGVYLSNDLVSAVAVPGIGGRLLSFSLGPHEFLFINEKLQGQIFTAEEQIGDGTIGSWKNYGGAKTWPSPEFVWGGPPDPVLDTGPWAWDVSQADSEASVTMTSEKDPRTGLRVTRRVILRRNTSRLTLQVTFKNVTEAPVHWGIWDIVQLDCSRRRVSELQANPECQLYMPGPTTGGPPPSWHIAGNFGDQVREGADGQSLVVQFLGNLGKIAARSDAGWMAFSDISEGYTFCLTFPHDPAAEYPDSGATVECYTESPLVTPTPEYGTYASVGCVLEAEVLGPVVELAPGETTQLTIEYAVCRLAGPILAGGEAGCVSERLRVTQRGNYAVVEGHVGVFEVGDLFCVWRDEAGVPLHRSHLQAASPYASSRLDNVIALPQGAVGAALELHRRDGSIVGLIDTATIASEV